MNDTRPYHGHSDKPFPHTLPDGRTGYYKGDWYRGLPHLRGTFVYITKNYEKKYPNDSLELHRRIEGNLPNNFQESYENFLNECNSNNLSMATRKASKTC